MGRLIVQQGSPLRGCVRVPGDKSISHRALLLGSLAEGTSQVSGFLPSSDCLATKACLQALGIEVEVHHPTTLTIHGRGLHGLRAPTRPLDCARSGTTMRLLTGILAGQPFESTLTGDEQLLRRPMRRVVEPLRQMGAEIEDTEGHAPLTIRGPSRPLARLRGHDHSLPIASAQVKSALLLAGLYADGPTIVRQPGPARDHTERMLKLQIVAWPPSNDTRIHESRIMQGGKALTFDAQTITLNPDLIVRLQPLDMVVPGDFSSAAFLLIAAALMPGSEVTVEGVGVNPTRTGLLDVLRAMGADVVVEDMREQGNEPVADVTARASDLTGVEIGGDTVVRMIDEFPALAVAATQAHGTTTVHNASELRVKETDRIATIVAELQALGARIEPLPDGFIVEGPTPLRGAVVNSHGDHRLAMALTVAGLIAEGQVVIENTACIADSFPGFVEVMREAGAL